MYLRRMLSACSVLLELCIPVRRIRDQHRTCCSLSGLKTVVLVEVSQHISPSTSVKT